MKHFGFWSALLSAERILALFRTLALRPLKMLSALKPCWV